MLGRPTLFALSGSNSARVGCAFDRQGSFHLPEEREHHNGQLRHGILRIGGINPDRVSQVPDSDAAACQVVDEVQSVPDGTAQPVQGVHHEDVPRMVSRPRRRPCCVFRRYFGS